MSRYLRPVHFFRGTILLIVLFSLSPQSPSSHSTPTGTASPDSLLLQYDAFVDSFMTESKAPGVAIAVVKEDQIVYIKGFGHRRIDARERIDGNTVFRIASLSKGFASVLTGLLVHDGLLQWDEHVMKYLPDFALRNPKNTRELTIRHLLSHTSGLLAHSYDSLIEDNVEFEQMARQLREVPITCAVGECYSYQNVAYGLIGPIIANATGKTYQDLLAERIFKPLGMTEASLSKAGMLATRNVAYPHVMRKAEWHSAEIRDTYYSVPPAAGVNASVHDMALWLRALMGGIPQVVPPEVVQEVSEPVVVTPRERRRFNWNRRIRSAHYGLGWRIFDYAGHKLVFHSGSVYGYLSQIAFLPEEKIGIVVLQNSAHGNPFVYEFFDRYLRL
ncbi:beta-lactamase family protein [candidate division KSB1 bacterium]|nr:beta-lactamase family protein [candidate division KSB1 bacterium]